jgi:hypothetical protein
MRIRFTQDYHDPLHPERVIKLGRTGRLEFDDEWSEPALDKVWVHLDKGAKREISFILVSKTAIEETND